MSSRREAARRRAVREEQHRRSREMFSLGFARASPTPLQLGRDGDGAAAVVVRAVGDATPPPCRPAGSRTASPRRSPADRPASSSYFPRPASSSYSPRQSGTPRHRRRPVASSSKQPLYCKSPVPIVKRRQTKSNRSKDDNGTAIGVARSARGSIGPRSETPLGRSTPRWKRRADPAPTPVPDVAVDGQGISAASALTNGQEQVNVYLRSLWASSGSCPVPNRPSSVAVGAAGTITLREHQRVLAHCLRDYTRRLGLAYKNTMQQQTSIREFQQRETNARLRATIAAFRETKLELFQAEEFIDRLAAERDQFFLLCQDAGLLDENSKLQTRAPPTPASRQEVVRMPQAVSASIAPTPTPPSRESPRDRGDPALPDLTTIRAASRNSSSRNQSPLPDVQRTATLTSAAPPAAAADASSSSSSSSSSATVGEPWTQQVSPSESDAAHIQAFVKDEARSWNN